jgi:hypothetical protein
MSHLIGCAKSHAVNLKAVLHADLELKQLIRENKIRNLEKAALIAGIQSEDIKQFAMKECISGATFKKLKMIAAQDGPRRITNKPTEKRGRHTVSVNFGSTKNMTVAKLVLDSVLNNLSLSHLTPHFKHIDFNDHRSVADAFKRLVKKLEELNT